MMFTLQVAEGGEAELLVLQGDNATILSPRPAAPGSRFVLKVDRRTLRLKVHRCVRQTQEDPATFKIAGRFIDLPRDLRVKMLRAISSEAPATAATPATPSSLPDDP